ncbi:MAG: DEAD/DEAH box helicase [Phycisphaerae bacterium]|nr:DEAD/DEAH box helicase [Phycisphaerae bacterium]
MPFRSLGLAEPILSAVEGRGYTVPTPIQSRAIGPILEGRDVLGCAQTGTGKTAAFSLPILQRLGRRPHPTKKQADRHAHPIRCLILSPTRELTAQIGQCIDAYGAGTGLKHTVIFGGVRQRGQTRALREGVDIVVATPGRLIDLIGQGHVDLGQLEIFVLDEADRMLDMGFIEDIWRILSYVPEQRQSLLFSATMPPKIQHLANAILRDPAEIRVAPEAPVIDTIEQRFYLVEWAQRSDLLKHLLRTEDVRRALVFTQTKRRADVLVQELKAAGFKADVIHSDRNQQARKRALENFRKGKKPILVASDIAARGLDVEDVSHVINYELPREAEVYVHRIGRTGRAGARGVSMSFCTLEERTLLTDIEKLVGQPVTIVEDHPFPSNLPRLTRQAEKKPNPQGVRSNRRPTGRRRL